MRPSTLRARLGKPRKSVPEGLRVAQGAENGFFCKKRSLFDFRPHNSPLFDENRGVLGGFAKKKVSKLFFLRDFFSIFVIFLPLLTGGSALQGPQPLLSRFRTCQKMSKKCQFFFSIFFSPSNGVQWPLNGLKWSQNTFLWPVAARC